MDPSTLRRHFGTTDVLPLWIAEPDLPLAEPIVQALRQRAGQGWFGYQTRPAAILDAFWGWMAARHGWDGVGLRTVVSPSVGTSLGALIELLTEPGDGVILQPPVFTDFKPLVTSAGRTVVRNALRLVEGRYAMDLDDLAERAADPSARMLILCNPHNPVGRVWTEVELAAVAQVCAEHDVVVVADEVHADITLAPHEFTPFARAAAGTRVRWAAAHGPIKTFGMAGVCDTLLVTDDAEIAGRFEALSSRLHLTRNNAFALAAFEAAYTRGGAWFDDLLGLVARNVEVVRAQLPEGIRLMPLEGTYLVWLDLRALDLPVGQVGPRLAAAGVAVSPGHWFGREGAGFARMTIAASTPVVERAASLLAGVRTDKG